MLEVMAGCRTILSILVFIALPVDSFGHPAPIVPFGSTHEIYVCSDTIIRVIHRPTSKALEKVSLIAKADWPPVKYNASTVGDVVTVQTAKLTIELSASMGTAKFMDRSSRKLILQEKGASFRATRDLGRSTFQVQQTWVSTQKAEGLYGGGSYQNGIVNYKNAPIQMIQFNTEAVVPFFASTEGYGLLWDNYAWTYLNPPERALVAQGLMSSGNVSFTPVEDGDHFFYVGKPFPKDGDTPSFGSGVENLQVFVSLIDPTGKQIVVHHWDKLVNMPNSLTGRAPGLKTGVPYEVHYSTNLKGSGLYVQGPEYGKTVLRSFIGDAVDYYFVYGRSLDGSVAGYREITGTAPLYSKWVYGFWQCKEHYAAQEELLQAAHEFRKRSIPVDAIVQDWHYWGDLGWGPQWDPKAYPDPMTMVERLQTLNIHLMVSVWSKFDKSTVFWKRMNSSGWILGSSEYYDAFHPTARELYYNFSKASMFSIGVDSLWQDATEPEFFPNANAETFLGSGNAYMNAYSLMTTKAIADGLRRDFPHAQGARVFTLTRSSFAAQQTTGAVVWTGDISGNWDSLRRQIASAINYQYSGIPYWAQDIGGFFRPKDQYSSPDYHELLTRWFQFGVFTPIFRVHGAATKTELWNFGVDVMENINASAIALRYRLLPYTYSGFARVERNSYTMLRGLPMDFPEDSNAYNIADEFMYGDAFLVTPIHTASAGSTLGKVNASSSRPVYFPKAAWVNFHTGETFTGGATTVSFRVSEAPVFVRAGSVVPLGPALQYSGQGPADPLEVRIYPGADASFTLFEDDGFSSTNRAYLSEASIIVLEWNDQTQELAISDRLGSYVGMLEKRIFQVVFVSAGHGVGVAPTKPDAVVQYSGQRVVVKRSGVPLLI